MDRLLTRTTIILGVVLSCWGIADAFTRPQYTHHVKDNIISPKNHQTTFLLPTSVSNYQCGDTRLSLSKDDGGVTDLIVDLDKDLAREIEDALSLAQEALANEIEEEGELDEEDIDEIANMLLETPPIAPPTQPAVPIPPKEEPPIIPLPPQEEPSIELMEQQQQPLPPQSPPPADAISFAESLQKKAAEELDKLKLSIFGVEDELTKTETNIVKEEEMADKIKKEIEDSIQKRKDMVKRIEDEFAAEKKLLVEQMEIASAELKEVMDESAQNITDAKSKAAEGENVLLSQMDSLKSVIDEVTAKAININIEKEEIERSKQTILGKVIQEGKDKLARFRKSFDVDISYAKQINADLQRRVEVAEKKVRDVYDQINSMRNERLSLQQQIADVENNALEEISSLQRELKENDEKYAATLQKERDRLDGVIDVAYQAYAIRVCKKITARQAVEAEYKTQLREVNAKVIAAKEKHQARVSEYLDKLEEKHRKERIAIYQEKIEAVAALRKEMNDELAIENAKIEEIHSTMQAKIDAVQDQTAQVKAEFEKDLAERRKVSKEEEEELLGKIEDVRVDMTDKIKTQRRLYEEKKDEYLVDMNAEISKSEAELHQKWRELAGIKTSHNDVTAKRNDMATDVRETQALIDSYENDRKSFKKSVSLTANIAKEKIRTKTRRLLRREDK